MIYLSNTAAVSQLSALASYIDQGSNNATFVFYDSTKPTTSDVSADNGAKLVTLTLPKPSLKQVNTDSIELNPTDTAVAVKTGTARWARLFNGDGKAVADFEVGIDITLANTSLIVGGTLSIVSIKLRPYTGQ